MECQKIKELLNEYIDGTLDAQLKELVEGHLPSCNNCTQELNSLKAYLKTVGSLERIDAPQDFLKNLHERLQEQSKFRNLIKKIFIPVRIKVPFEVVGVAATVLFTIYLVKIIQPVEEISTFTQLSKSEITTDKSAEEDKSLGPEAKRAVVPSEKMRQNRVPLSLAEEKGKITLPAVSGESKAVLEKKPIDLVLLIRTDMKSGAYYKGSKLAEPVLEVGAVKKEKEDMWMARDSGEGRIAKTAIDETNEKILKDNIIISPQIESLVESSGGRILSLAYGEDNNQPQVIFAEIARENYSTLLKSLSELVEFQKPSPSVIKAEEDSIQIRIRLTPFE